MRLDIEVPVDADGIGLRSFLASRLVQLTPKSIRRSIQRGQITVNGSRVPSNHRLHTGDMIMVHIQESFSNATDIAVDVLHEDEHLAVLDKPAGIPVHGRGSSIARSLKHLVRPSKADDALLNPVILHRLDKPTSGALIIAKTSSSVRHLSRQFQEHLIQKTYLAIVNGCFYSKLMIDLPIEGKPAVSHAAGLQYRPDLDRSLIELNIETGRTHQIRRHLSLIGYPLTGDKRYGGRLQNHPIALLARSVVFVHPEHQKEMRITAPLTEPFKKFLKA